MASASRGIAALAGMACALALAPALGAQTPPSAPRSPASAAGPRVPPVFPWEIEPLDAIYGHLSEGAFQEPTGVCFEAHARELYVADSRNGLIGIFDDGRIPLFAFGGASKLVEPHTVLATEDGTIYVLDALQSELHVFDYRGETRAPLRFQRPPRAVQAARAESKGAAKAPANKKPVETKPASALLRIGAFARDAQGRWYVGDLDEGRVLVYDRELAFVRELEPSARAGEFRTLVDIALSPTGLVAVADMQGAPAIHVYDEQGRLLAAFGERDIGLKDFTAPIALAFDEQGFLYALDLLRHDVKVFSASGDFVYHFGGWFAPETRGHAPGELLYPADIAIDPQGTIYIAERYGQRVQAFTRKPKPAPAQRAPAAAQDAAR